MPEDEWSRAAEAIADGQSVDREATRPLVGEERLEGMQLVADVAQAMRALSAPRPDEADFERRQWGSLELRECVGQGGFGTVYRAFDPALDREVALKLYRGEAQASASRLLAEARRLAKVKHPNVLAIHGVDVREGRPGLWTDLLHGKSLTQWVETNGPLGPSETVAIASDLCRALAAIHAIGLVHGDVKPSNVMREVGGRIVLMDFGAARTQGGDSTEPIAGTPVSTAPEILAGGDPSPASDLYSLGVLLYFLLTARYPIAGHTFQDVVDAHRNRTAIPLSDIRPDLPPSLIEVIGRALEPDPARRFASAGEMLQALSPFALSGSGAADSRRRSLVTAVGIGTAFVAGALLVGLIAWLGRPPARPLVHAQVVVAPEAPLAIRPIAGLVAPAIAISPDGRRLGYIAERAGRTEIRVRDLTSKEVASVPGTEGAYQLAFSPDGESVVFGRPGVLARASIRGGGAVTLADAPMLLGATWSPSGTVYFVPAPRSAVHAVDAEGGETLSVTALDPALEIGHAFPEIAAGGEWLLYVAMDRAEHRGTLRIVAESLRTGQRSVVVEGGVSPRYSSDGRLLYAREGAVFAIDFDPRSGRTTGTARAVVSGLLVDRTLPVTPYDISASGALVWVAARAAIDTSSLAWLDGLGTNIEHLSIPPGTYLHPRLAPDGSRLVVESRALTDDLWVWDLARNIQTRLTFDGDNLAPLWTPDGQRVTFARHTVGPPNLFWIDADGNGEPERLTTSERSQIPGSWSSDGSILAYTEIHPVTGQDLWLLRVDGEPIAEPLLRTPFDEREPAISSGGILAYTSNETGRPEIYIRALVGQPSKRRVSVSGGTNPVWSRDGSAIHFRNGDTLLTAGFDNGESGVPKPLFERRIEMGAFGPNYDVAADGRFLVVEPPDPVTPPNAIELILNWPRLLDARP